MLTRNIPPLIFSNHKGDKETALLSQAILYLSKVLEKQAPVPDSAPPCNSLPSLQSDRCIFFGSLAAPAPRRTEKWTVRSPLLSNTRSCCRSFLHCCGTGQSAATSATFSRVTRVHQWHWQQKAEAGCAHARQQDTLRDVVQTKQSTGVLENIQHTSCPTWILELIPWTYLAHQWHLTCQTKIPHKRGYLVKF